MNTRLRVATCGNGEIAGSTNRNSSALAFQSSLPFRPVQSQSRAYVSTSHLKLASVPRPPRVNRPRKSSRPVVAWLSNNPIQNAKVLAAAQLSARLVLRVYHPSLQKVIQAAKASFADVVYLHASLTAPTNISMLQSNGIRPIIIGTKETLPVIGIAGVATAIAAAPLLLERKGDAVTRFYDNDDQSGGMLIQNGVKDERGLVDRVVAWLVRVYLPTGFPHTTTPDYMSFTKYRTLQNLASAIMQVISTEALLFGLGLGKTVAAGAAATSWVLKDGASYIVKILYGGVFGSRFDDDPKSWRIAADVVEDVGGAIEILTPLFPLVYFLPLASLAVCLRGMSMMTGTATRHVVYRSLAASGIQNTGDIATKGESQGVTMKMLGLGTGIVISSRIGQNYYALLGAYGLLAVVHIVANWKSVQCVQFSFFNKQRASILIETHLTGAPIPTPHEVSSIEKIILPPWVGFEPSVKLGATVAESVPNSQALIDAKKTFRSERFMIFVLPNGKDAKVLLEEKATSKDVLKAYYTVKKFMHSKNRSTRDLEDSYKYMKRNIAKFENLSKQAGWDTRHMLLTDGPSRVSR